MLIDRYPVEDVFARVPEVAAQTDPVLKTLDTLLENDQLCLRYCQSSKVASLSSMLLARFLHYNSAIHCVPTNKLTIPICVSQSSSL